MRKFVRVFVDMEKAFWHRVFFKKRLMILFMLGIPSFSILVLPFLLFSWIWWVVSLSIFLGYFVMFPFMVFGVMPTKSNPLNLT